MKYLVIEGPAEWASERLASDSSMAKITADAFEFYAKLESQGKLEQYVRLDGPPGGVLIFDVDSPEEFAKLRAEDPLVPLLGNNIKVIPLANMRPAQEMMEARARMAAGSKKKAIGK